MLLYHHFVYAAWVCHPTCRVPVFSLFSQTLLLGVEKHSMQSWPDLVCIDWKSILQKHQVLVGQCVWVRVHTKTHIESTLIFWSASNCIINYCTCYHVLNYLRNLIFWFYRRMKSQFESVYPSYYWTSLDVFYKLWLQELLFSIENYSWLANGSTTMNIQCNCIRKDDYLPIGPTSIPSLELPCRPNKYSGLYSTAVKIVWPINVTDLILYSRWQRQ